jgi:hypothetical protein
MKYSENIDIMSVFIPLYREVLEREILKREFNENLFCFVNEKRSQSANDYFDYPKNAKFIICMVADLLHAILSL